MNGIKVVLFSVLALVSGGCHAEPGSQTSAAAETSSVTQTSSAKTELLVEPATSLSVAGTNESVTLRLNQNATHDGLTLSWLEVRDSRCPKGVECFQAGEVSVILQASSVQAVDREPVKFQLTLPVRGEPAGAEVFGYQLELLKVEPYPEDGIVVGQNDYLAVTKISVVSGTN